MEVRLPDVQLSNNPVIHQSNFIPILSGLSMSWTEPEKRTWPLPYDKCRIRDLDVSGYFFAIQQPEPCCFAKARAFA
jgi:hypothetical protein